MSEGTPIETRADILGEFWINYKSDLQFKDFIQYNDLGLPLSYAISSGIVEPTKLAKGFINETFDLLLEAMNIEDEGFDSLDDLTMRYGS